MSGTGQSKVTSAPAGWSQPAGPDKVHADVEAASRAFLIYHFICNRLLNFLRCHCAQVRWHQAWRAMAEHESLLGVRTSLFIAAWTIPERVHVLSICENACLQPARTIDTRVMLREECTSRRLRAQCSCGRRHRVLRDGPRFAAVYI